MSDPGSVIIHVQRAKAEVLVLRAVETFGFGPDRVRKDLHAVFHRLYLEGYIEQVWQLTARGNAELCNAEYQKDRAEDERGDFR